MSDHHPAPADGKPPCSRDIHAIGKQQLQRLLAFERRLTVASAALMRSDDDVLDRTVVDTLASIGSFFGVDRAYLFEIDEQAGHQSNTHEWVADGISAEAANLQQVPLTVFPWLLGELRADRGIAIADMATLPAEAVNEHEEFDRQSIQSIAIVPIWEGTQLAGFVGFDAVRQQVQWDEEYMVGLRLMAQMFGSALRARAMARQLQVLAFHDALTGLPNRMLLLDRLESALRRERRNRRSLVVLLLDLDDFKHINDAYGHAAGDAVLCEVARRLERAVRATDTVARLAGDEFVLLVENAGVPTQRTAERLLLAFEAPFVGEGVELRLSPSIGIAVADIEHDTVDGLLRRADAAMYRGKSAGGHRWVCDGCE